MAKKQTAAKPADENKKRASTKAAEAPVKDEDEEEEEASEEGDEEEASEDDEDEPAAQPANGKKAEVAAASVDQKARVAAILRDPQAKGREDLAQELALETDLTPEQASKILAKAPKVEAAKAENPLEKAMNSHGSPNPGAGGEGGAENKVLSNMAKRFAKK